MVGLGTIISEELTEDGVVNFEGVLRLCDESEADELSKSGFGVVGVEAADSFCGVSEAMTGVGFEANVFEGKVIKHTAKFHLPVPEHSSGADLNFQWKTYGKKT